LESLADIRLEVRRIALTQDDTRALGDATRFSAASKKADSRYEWFVRRHGYGCWELDALSPTLLRDRIEQAILAVLDTAAWERWSHVEKLEMEAIAETCRSWGSILVQDQK
jgi:hypothetical protein